VPLAQGKRRILVPGHQPVGNLRFVEQCGAIGNGFGAQNLSRHSEKTRVTGDHYYRGISHGVANSRAAARQIAESQFFLEGADLCVMEYAVPDRKTLFRDLR
jgi:hypothetical protein